MKCQRCSSNRIIIINCKHSDMFGAEMHGIEHNGYAPHIRGICGGDYTEFNTCLECGQMQGIWPQPTPEFAKQATKE